MKIGKIISSIVSLGLLGLIAYGVYHYSDGFTNFNLSSWFNKEEPVTDIETEEKYFVCDGARFEAGTYITFCNSIIYTNKTESQTVNEDDCINLNASVFNDLKDTKLTWSATWTESNTNNVYSYINFDVSEDTQTAKLQILKPFNDQITLMVNNEKSIKTCKLDYDGGIQYITYGGNLNVTESAIEQHFFAEDDNDIAKTGKVLWINLASIYYYQATRIGSHVTSSNDIKSLIIENVTGRGASGEIKADDENNYFNQLYKGLDLLEYDNGKNVASDYIYDGLVSGFEKKEIKMSGTTVAKFINDYCKDTITFEVRVVYDDGASKVVTLRFYNYSVNYATASSSLDFSNDRFII